MVEKYIDSSNKKDRLCLRIWMPAGQPGHDGYAQVYYNTKAPKNKLEYPQVIVQITHGMLEHLGRYEELALFLNSHGIGVIGHDTLGHGKSVQTTSQKGFFARKNGDKYLVADVSRVTSYIKKHYPGSRIVLLGHSMGSFVSRQYLTQYGGKIDGAILMGTGDPGLLAIMSGEAIAGFLRVLRGDFYRSRLINSIMLDSNDRYFEDSSCKSWLSGCKEEVDKYNADENCGFLFTVSAYLDLFRILKKLAKNTKTSDIPKDLPILLMSGEDDAIGEFGKGVGRVCERYRAAGIRDVEMKIYPELRHELLHETKKEEVQKEILKWIQDRFPIRIQA